MKLRSLPTRDVEAWIGLGAVYVRPDFERADHSIMKFRDATHALNATAEHWLNERQANKLAHEVGRIADELGANV